MVQNENENKVSGENAHHILCVSLPPHPFPFLYLVRARGAAEAEEGGAHVGDLGEEAPQVLHRLARLALFWGGQ